MASPDSDQIAAATSANQNGMIQSFLEAVSLWANVSVVALTVLAAIAGVFALYFSSELAARKDTELTRFQAESKAAIAASDARAAEANEKAAGAAAGTARALGEAAAASERAGKVELEAERQRERAANAEQELGALKARIADRHLTSDQRRKLITVLSGEPKGEIEVNCVGPQPEPCAFASEIVDVLKAVGWNVSKFIQGVIPVGGTPVGLAIRVNSKAAPARAAALQKAFAAVGLSAPGIVAEGLPEDSVILEVGSKPSTSVGH